MLVPIVTRIHFRFGGFIPSLPTRRSLRLGSTSAASMLAENSFTGLWNSIRTIRRERCRSWRSSLNLFFSTSRLRKTRPKVNEWDSQRQVHRSDLRLKTASTVQSLVVEHSCFLWLGEPTVRRQQ